MKIMALRGIMIQFYIECRQTAAVGAYCRTQLVLRYKLLLGRQRKSMEKLKFSPSP